MSDVIPKIAQNLFSSQVEITSPSTKYVFDPCGPEGAPTDSSDITVLYPDTNDSNKKTVPLMGGSIVKISINPPIDTSDERYIAYYKNINERIKKIFNEKNIDLITKKSTSVLRVYLNKLLVEGVSSDQNIGVVPTLYLSTTLSNLAEIEARKDYFGIIKKNAIFSFFPIESIKECLAKLSIKNESTSAIGEWSGLSGYTYKELYEIASKKSPTEEQIKSLILDTIPFVNLSEEELTSDPVTPAFGGYFTIINNSIYLKMPDISGVDSAGFGEDILEETNLLFQVLSFDVTGTFVSIKNIEVKKTSPVYSNILETETDEYSLKNPEEFSITFLANKKPNSVYLSPAINDDVEIKNNLFKLIRASQSGSFIEHSPYPNPFTSIFDDKIIIKENSLKKEFTYADKIDEPFKKVYFRNFTKIKKTLNTAYNNGLGKTGPIWKYLESVIDYEDLITINDPIKSYETGFPFSQELFEKTNGGLGQTLSTYEFVGNLSRENLILHNGEAYDDSNPRGSGRRGNNSKYFNKKFIANNSGLSQNYRPRVFSKIDSFIPSVWIKSSSIQEVSEGVYSATFSGQSFLKFYTEYASEMKFVMYTSDGINQLSKVENGYLHVTMKPPEIISITPDGSAKGGVIISCGETSIIIISKESKYVDTVKINDFEIKRDSSWIVSSNSLSVKIPCAETILEGNASVSIGAGGLFSSPSYIYIANGIDTVDPTENVSDLPSTIDSLGPFSADEVSPQNLKISGQNYEVPISYLNPKSAIQIKSKKRIFKEGRPIYLYLGFKTESNAKDFSQSIVYYSNSDIYIAKDFNYKLENSLSSDFYRVSKSKAYLYFPGNNNLSKPLEILIKKNTKVFLILSTKAPGEFSVDDNLGVLQLGTDTRPAFVGPPLVIGIAANYLDRTSKNHFSNFLDETSYIADIILDKEGITSTNKQDLIDAKDKFKKLIVLFSYREIKKYKRKNFSLYIGGKKVGRILSTDGAKRASSLEGTDEDSNVLLYNKARNLYYFVATNFDVMPIEPPEVRIDVYDPDFKVTNSSRNKYRDFSIRVPKDGISKAADDSGSIFINKEILLDNSVETLFGDYDAQRALTGFFLKTYSYNQPIMFLFDTFPGVEVSSNITGTISDSDSLASSNEKITILKNTPSSTVSNLPNAYFTISSGSELYSNEYLESNEDYLIFHRLEVQDICRIGMLTPRFVNVPDKYVVSPGQVISLYVENILRNFVIKIAGVEAKVVGKSQISDNLHKVDVIVPEGVPAVILANDCGWMLYNGNQDLLSGINQLGKNLADTLDRVAAGLLGEVNKQFEKFKQILEDAPLKFLGITMEDVNLAKELITSFCNYSFKIVADLSINLQGFSQLLIPIKVILCIIDVICNLFNPFQLPLAIIRLFECLYDLILLLPQISIPVMFFNLMIHLLDFLECLIVKIVNAIIAINLIIDAVSAAVSGRLNFREIMMLEEVLLKYVISLDADISLMDPILQVLAIFLQLLSLSFRFPCSINPNSMAAPCGIDGFELASMISGMIAEPSGSAPHIAYNLDKKYLIPVAQPFTTVASESVAPPSYESSTEPVRGSIAFDGSSATDGNLYDLSSFNPESLRKKSASFDPANINDITTDEPVSLKISYTRRRKHLSSQQGVIFKFKGRTWKSFIPVFDRQIIDEYQNFDTPPVPLQKDGLNLKIPSSSEYGNFYSMIDGKSMMTISDGKGTIKPLTIDITQNGVATERTFETIPSMVLMDEELNVYIIDEEGIIFDSEAYEQYSDGSKVSGIKEIRATIINQKSSVGESFSKEEESINTGTEEEPVEEINDIFSMPQLYFVDTRVAAEAIQAKCQTASINQLPLDLSGDGGLKELEKQVKCINDFLDSVRLQTGSIKEALSLGKVPEKMSQDKVDAAFVKLVDCTNETINNLCSIVINPLNTSFKLIQDTDETPILPDPVSSAEEVSGSDSLGPPLTGAREYAGGIGDAVTSPVNTSVFVQLIPRDSYDNLITYDLSSKIRLQIISDTTGNATITLNPTDSNPQNYWVYNNTDRSYLTSIKSSAPGIVKLKVTICNQPVQALTYADLANTTEESDKVDCVPDGVDILSQTGSIPLGSLSRIDRILTITFVSLGTEVIVQGASEDSSIITEPQLFGTNLEN